MGCHANGRKAHNEVHELSEVENEQLNEGLADGVGGFIHRTTVLQDCIVGRRERERGR